MRFLVLAFLCLSTVLAGCSGSDTASPSCPDALPDEYVDAYHSANEQLAEQNITVEDSDADCVYDQVEQAFGTDPADAADFPDFQNMTAEEAQAAFGGGATVRVWTSQTFEGVVQGAAGVNPGFLTADNTFTVPGGASEAWFNFTIDAEGVGEVDLRNIPDGCSAADCFVEATTSGLKADIHVTDRLQGGSWTVAPFPQAARVQGTYSLTVTSLVEVDATTMAV